MHWTQKVPELWALTLALSCFGYTGALDRNMAAGMTVTALACMASRKLLMPNGTELTGCASAQSERNEV